MDEFSHLRRSDTGSRIVIFYGSTKYHQNISPDKTYIVTLFKNFYQVIYFANEYSIDHTCNTFSYHLFRLVNAQVRMRYFSDFLPKWTRFLKISNISCGGHVGNLRRSDTLKI